MKKVIFVLIFFLFQEIFAAPQPQPTAKPPAKKTELTDLKKLPLPFYKTEPISFNKTAWLTSEQLSEHYKLYQGYVDKLNEITKKLENFDRSEASNATYSVYREINIERTFAMNANVLHKYFFQNIAKPSGENRLLEPGTLMMKLIIESFGSVDAFKDDFFAAARSSRGWVITAYALDDNRIYNFILDTHNQIVPVLVMPLLILDVYEHAYFLDFGTKRVSYLDLFWKNINWNVVEDRVIKWVMPFRPQEHITPYGPSQQNQLLQIQTKK